jgi:hypothetical protein
MLQKFTVYLQTLNITHYQNTEVTINSTSFGYFTSPFPFSSGLKIVVVAPGNFCPALPIRKHQGKPDDCIPVNEANNGAHSFQSQEKL